MGSSGFVHSGNSLNSSYAGSVSSQKSGSRVTTDMNYENGPVADGRAGRGKETLLNSAAQRMSDLSSKR